MNIFFIIILCIPVILYVIGLFKVFEKAGEKGWKSLILFYNSYILCKISKRSILFYPHVLLFFLRFFSIIFEKSIPSNIFYIIMFLSALISTIVMIKILNGLSKSFGKDFKFTIGLTLFCPIFMLILGFSDIKYKGELL